MMTTRQLAAGLITHEYARARDEGLTQSAGAECAWAAYRAHPLGRRARAPHGMAALGVNTSVRRSYRVPLGALLGIAGSLSCGQHCARWPRTKASMREHAGVQTETLAALEAAR